MNKIYYKIGVTVEGIKTRFRGEPKYGATIITLKTWDYLVGGDAYAKEDEILKEFSKYKTKDKPLHKKGNTEVFDIDILNLDRQTSNTP